ncbi:type II secretion system protein F [Alteromonas australica]|jgi:type IV pilus assembly protein PilC|uniref:Type II secretion system protein F n=1 Tax=Alteromonas australica TaxID=589873 RepID=A0A075NYM6_9ALTE|nr:MULTISPECIES: type II secretion system F family protein [Alteromonas]MAO31130.1 type II secretion system F family protein [Alteromonas sp.]AIF99764.1 type II secretion system protein F [Alteromonas australica]AJP44743.1 type II secretion system protein F [Alteromonas australica]QPL50978.1 type II secretion system F family protein [Alteromonas sp. B31-7]HBF71047.1 type II secretion system F family protein [Alteromonas australica]|tara:strand:+ start:4748 stop:5959 length:1212 start_codon:yes stop_codon:yes gene_type:complete
MAKAATTYTWQGKDRRGNSRKGEISAISLAEAKNLLRRQGISANKVKKLATPLFGRGAQKIVAADISVMSRQIATMLGAGVTLIQSLDMIAQGHAKASMRKLLHEISNEVKSGNPLSGALRKHPDYFDDLYCDLVYTGEQSGALETIYDRIATYKEKAEALKSKIKKAMLYPIAVVVVAFVVTTILLIFVVPQFEDIFSSFGAELPAFTQFVLAISRFVQDYGFVMAIAAVGAGMLFVRAHKKSQSLRDNVDKAILKAPVVGEILKKASIARFTRTLATTFSAGVPLIGALESAAGASGNAVFRDAILFMRKEVAGGMQMHTAMRATNVFPDMVTQMVAIGEESGAVDSMLSKIATIYEAEVDDMVDGLTSLLEPIIMAVLGVVIGGLIVAMYLPIFEMGNVV